MNKTDIERQISSIANIVRMRAEVHRNIEAFGVPICRCIDPSCFSYTSKGTLRPILVMSSVKWAVLLKHRYEILSMISKGGGIAMLEKGFYVRGFNRSTNEYSKKVFYEVSKLSGGRHNLNLIVEDKALQEVMESADDILACISSYGKFLEIERLKKKIRKANKEIGGTDKCQNKRPPQIPEVASL